MLNNQIGRALTTCLALVCLGLLCQPAYGQGRNRVELQLASEGSARLGGAQKWLEVLSNVGADSVRMVTTTGRVKIDVQKTETSTGNSYKILGAISADNRLILPAGRFTLSQTAKIREYITSIRADGAEVALSEKLAFGLTAKQLVGVHTALSPAYEGSTKGAKPSEILLNLKNKISLPIEIDESAAEALRGDYQLQDDLQGMSAGTVIAASLRPLGLVIAPVREQGQPIRLMISDARRIDEHWPIGWPLEKNRPTQILPKLNERIPVNIQNFKMGDTLNAIQQALEVPFLYDYNSMAREGVELNDIRVNLQSGEQKMSYILVLRRIVVQAKPRMQHEIRVDENGKPFYWFSAQ